MKFGSLLSHLGLSDIPKFSDVDLTNADEYCYYRLKKYLSSKIFYSDLSCLTAKYDEAKKFNLPVHLYFEEDAENQVHLQLEVKLD